MMWTRVPGYGGNVEGRRSTRRALDAGILNHVGPVFSAGRSDPRRQDVTINVRRYAIHRCVWVRPPTHVSAVAAPVPRRAAALVALSRGHRWTVSNPEHGHTSEPTTGRAVAGSSTPLVSWSVRLRRPCGGVRGAAGWAFREQARDRRRAPRRPAPARDRWLRVQRPARRHLTDRRSI